MEHAREVNALDAALTSPRQGRGVVVICRLSGASVISAAPLALVVKERRPSPTRSPSIARGANSRRLTGWRWRVFAGRSASNPVMASRSRRTDAAAHACGLDALG